VNTHSKDRTIVYFILGDKAFRYDDKSNTPKVNGGRSKILYIGMTEKGDTTEPFLALRRKAVELWSWGLKNLEVRYVSPQGRQNVSAVDELETACLYQFAQMFGCLPRGNKKAKWNQYSEKELERVFRHFPPFEKIRPLLREIGG
jgi:hypothetical protein